MPKYVALQKGYLSHEKRIIEKGEEFSFDGPPSPWMKPLNPGEHAPEIVKKDDPNSHGPVPKGVKAAKV